MAENKTPILRGGIYSIDQDATKIGDICPIWAKKTNLVKKFTKNVKQTLHNPYTTPTHHTPPITPGQIVVITTARVDSRQRFNSITPCQNDIRFIRTTRPWVSMQWVTCISHAVEPFDL